MAVEPSPGAERVRAAEVIAAQPLAIEVQAFSNVSDHARVAALTATHQ